MPTYMDIHEIQGGITAEAVAKAHAHDVAVEGKYGVHYHKYWVNESAGKIFCLCHAPSAEAAMQVHRQAHGMVAEKIIQVEPEVADLFLGGNEVNTAGAALLPGGASDARGPGTGRAKQRYFWNDCATGGAALFPRPTRPNPGIDRGSRTMYREGLIISSFG